MRYRTGKNEINEPRKITKTLPILIVTVLLVLLLLSGVVYAALRDTTAKVENGFETAYVECSVDEKFDGIEKKEVKVKNTGNVPAFIRVKVVVNWLDKSGNVIMYPPDGCYTEVKLNASNWTNPNGDDTTAVNSTKYLTNGYWYYKGIVQPEGSTDELINSIKATYTDVNLEEPPRLQVTIYAEAIQAAENQFDGDGYNAWEDKWKMTYDFDKSSWARVSSADNGNDSLGKDESSVQEQNG